MRLIDADKCEDYFYEHLDDDHIAGAMNAIAEMPTEVVKCQHCKYWQKCEPPVREPSFVGLKVCTYVIGARFVRNADDFCSRGERMAEG